LNLPEQDATGEDVRLKAVLDWLKQHPGWFLILDNVDTPEALEAWSIAPAMPHPRNVVPPNHTLRRTRVLSWHSFAP
jgi:hypothetical protein